MNTVNIKLKSKLNKVDKKRIAELAAQMPMMLKSKFYEGIIGLCQDILGAVEDPEDRARKWEELCHELNRPE